MRALLAKIICAHMACLYAYPAINQSLSLHFMTLEVTNHSDSLVLPSCRPCSTDVEHSCCVLVQGDRCT